MKVPFDLAGFIAAAEGLQKGNTAGLAAFYSEDCVFTDPFQTVHGRAAVNGVYQSMFNNLDHPRFCDIAQMGAAAGHELVLQWRFEFALKAGAKRQSIAGASRLEIDSHGLILRHTDFWDASMLMQSLPVVGPLIAWIRRKIAHA
jgi:hypothetical protein